MKRFLTLFVILSVMLTSGCDNPWSKMLRDAKLTTEEKIANGQEDGLIDLRLAYADFDTFNPLMTGNVNIKKAMSFVYDPLFKLDASLKPTGVIADSFECGECSMTIKLKQGIIWHDGSKLTARDVVYTIKAVAGGATQYWIDNLLGAVAIDSYTIKITFSSPKINPAPLFTFPIVKSGTSLTVDESYKPMGSGRFKFDGKRSVDSYVFVPFDDKARKGETFAKMILTKAPASEDISKLFSSGSIDCYFTKYNEKLTFKTGNGVLKQDISDRIVFLAFNAKNNILADNAVRIAINEVIDKNNIVSGILSEQAVATDLPAHPWSWVYEGFDTRLHFNRVDAANKLSSHGWELGEGDAYERMVNHNKQKLSFTLLYNSDDDVSESVANCIKRDLDEFGIEITLTSYTENAYEARKKDNNYDICLAKLDIGKNMDLDYSLSNNTCPNYTNNDLNELLWNLKTIATVDDIKAGYRAYANEFLKQMPFVPLYFKQEQIYLNPRIKAYSEQF